MTECNECQYIEDGVNFDVCPKCGSEDVIEAEYIEHPKQWDEPGYLDFVNRVGKID